MAKWLPNADMAAYGRCCRKMPCRKSLAVGETLSADTPIKSIDYATFRL
jgi:hypothetical protein